jgi:protein subunit release factor A
VNNVQAFMDGDLQPLIDALVQNEQAQKLADQDGM